MRLLLEQTARMVAETRGLDALAAESDWLTRLDWRFTSDAEVCVEFNIVVQSKVYEAILIYPNLFPQAPAYVRPRKADEVWSAHQYPGTGTLCLEWGPDTWHPDVTGADLIRSTYSLLTFEKIGPTYGISAPSRHETTLGQQLRATIRRFVVLPQLTAAVVQAGSAPKTPLTVATSSRFLELVSVATRLGGDEGPTLEGLPPELANPFIGGTFTRTGWMVRCDEWASLSSPAKSQSEIRAFLQGKECWPWADDEDRCGFLLLVDDNRNLRPIALGTGEGEGDTAYEYSVIDCSIDKVDRQPEQYRGLADKRVAIIGLGSVGSKIAVSLARSGVTRFLLIDDDILQPNNLSRNQLDWLSVGYDKVDGVRGAIRMVRADAEIQTRTFRFAGQESSASNTTMLEQIAACDLVIDATANSKVFSSAAAICTRRNISLIWGEVFAGGIGALMARSIPGIDAEPLIVRAAINEYLATLPEAPHKHAEGYDVEADNQVLIAGDAEVSHLAASLTQFAIDAIIPNETRRFPVAAYLLGYQRAWIFESPFDTRAIQCPSAPCEPQEAENTAAHTADLQELLAAFGTNTHADSKRPT